MEQSDEAWTLSLDVPGVAREQLTIEVDGTVVRLATVADAPRQFKAAYELPADIDADATSAKLENGVLTLTLGKKKPVVTSRTTPFAAGPDSAARKLWPASAVVSRPSIVAIASAPDPSSRIWRVFSRV